MTKSATGAPSGASTSHQSDQELSTDTTSPSYRHLEVTASSSSTTPTKSPAIKLTDAKDENGVVFGHQPQEVGPDQRISESGEISTRLMTRPLPDCHFSRPFSTHRAYSSARHRALSGVRGQGHHCQGGTCPRYPVS